MPSITASARPVWLLDVDGVINATRPGWHAAPHTATVHADGTAWKFRWNPDVTAFIRTVALTGHVEIRWATTWVPWAREVEATLRLPQLPEAFTTQDAREDPWAAKCAAALTVVETEHRPLVWTDDDIPTLGPLHTRLHQGPQPALLIAPQPRRGLQPEHLEAITAFLHHPG